jgi:hypothetical protein
MPRFNLGAFAGGLASGYMMGAQLERTEQQTKRDKEENERREREKAAYKALADLAESIVGPGMSPAYQPSGEATQAARGINPPSTRGTGAFGFSGVLPGVPTQPQQQPLAAPGVEINPVMGSQPPEARSLDEPPAMGDVRSVIARSGVREPAAAAAAAERPGPKTSDDKLGFALWRQPALFNDPRFAQGAAQIFLKAGMPEGVKWLERGARAQQENALTALRSLLQGDPQGAEEAFNSTGRVKIEPGSLKQIEEGRWQATIAGTGETRTFDPRQMYRSFLSPREFFELERRERADVSTAAHRERTAAETERYHRERENIFRMDAETRRRFAEARAARAAQGQPETALQRNTRHLVSIGAARDEAEAFAIMRQAGGKPEREGIAGLAKILMNRPGYMGRDGPARAMTDAAEMWRSMGGQQQPQAPSPPAAPAGPGAPAFKSAEDVRRAYKAGQLPRDQAERVLREQFGYQ